MISTSETRFEIPNPDSMPPRHISIDGAEFHAVEDSITSASEHPVDEEVQLEHVGWEYDEYVNAYKNHPRNSTRVRYNRDFAGFNNTGLQPFNSNSAASADDDGRLFVAYMSQFPLLDGLKHEQHLKRAIEVGKEAHLELAEKGDMDPESARMLKRLAIDGAGAYLTMFECNLKLVMSIATKQQESTSYSLGDAIGDGCLGLCRAIQKYDPEKGFKFSTYATNWIKQSIQRRRMTVVYGAAIPSGVYNDFRAIMKAKESAAEKDEDISDAELIEMGHKAEDITAVKLFFSLVRTSLDAPSGPGSNMTLADMISSPETDFAEQAFDDSDNKKLLQEICMAGNFNNSRDLAIFALLEGVILPGIDYEQKISIQGHQVASLGDYISMIREGKMDILRKDLVDTFGLSKERIRQIHDRTRAHFLVTASLESLAGQFSIPQQKFESLKAYIQFEGYGSKGRVADEDLVSRQKRAREAINTIRSLDVDFDNALFQTMNIIKDETNFNEAKLENMQSWLSHRYGFTKTDRIPITPSEAKTKFGFSEPYVVTIESIFLAVLSGVRGKIPDGIKRQTT